MGNVGRFWPHAMIFYFFDGVTSRNRRHPSQPSGGVIFLQVQFSAIWRNLPRWFPSPVLSGQSYVNLEINDLRLLANSRQNAQEPQNPCTRQAVRRTLWPLATNLHFKEQGA